MAGGIVHRSPVGRAYRGRHEELFEAMASSLHAAGVTRDELDHLLALPPAEAGQALHRAVGALQPVAPDSWDDLQSDTLEARRWLVDQGELISSDELALRIGMTRQAVNKAVRAGRMFALEVGSTRYLPSFFADSGIDRSMLERVALALGQIPGWSKWQFFTQPKGSLGGVTPLAALLAGRIEQVERSALGFAER